MARLAPLLAAILSSSLLIRTPAEASIFCARRKVLPASGVHYTFLRSKPRQAPASLRLYHGSWSHDGRALLSCAWSDDAAAIRDYLSLCRERAREFSDHLQESLHVGSMFGAEDPCFSVASLQVGERTEKRSLSSPPGVREDGSEGRSLQRMKRAFIVPGTLWCGSGDKAPSFRDLGLFTETDSCCREHDQCKNTILSFHSQFGLFNTNIFTMSHCDCDRKFRSCLLEAGDSISDVVGYTFFNLLKMHCFEFSQRPQCTQRNWFGMCKKTKMTVYAKIHPPTLYEAPAQLNTSGSTNTMLPEELMRSSSAQPQLPSSAPAGRAPHSPWTSSPPASASASDAGKTSGPRTQPVSHLIGMQQACSVYRDLDECGTRIPPLQKRFGLFNANITTLYHCNCTSRLFQLLANQKQLTEVHAALLGRVSLSCFLLQNCTAGKLCAAVQLTAQLPELQQRNAEAEKKRHLLVASVTGQGPKSKNRAVKLHQVCLRMVGKPSGPLSGAAGWKIKSRNLEKYSQQTAGRQ